MAIRLRIVEGQLIALCAARSIEQPGDIYLDDGAHHALGCKFARDYHEMYGYDLPTRDEARDLVEREESNNPARTWWDETYGKEA